MKKKLVVRYISEMQFSVEIWITRKWTLEIHIIESGKKSQLDVFALSKVFDKN